MGCCEKIKAAKKTKHTKTKKQKKIKGREEEKKKLGELWEPLADKQANSNPPDPTNPPPREIKMQGFSDGYGPSLRLSDALCFDL